MYEMEKKSLKPPARLYMILINTKKGSVTPYNHPSTFGFASSLILRRYLGFSYDHRIDHGKKNVIPLKGDMLFFRGINVWIWS